MKKLPIGIQSFEILRKNTEEYVYVDKTKEIYGVIEAARHCFLSRPRRFGKSLTCSTLQALFEGKKELFKNLWIAGEGRWEWEEHPIVYLNFAEIDHKSPERLEISLCRHLRSIATKYGISLDDSNNFPGDLLQELISFLSEPLTTGV